MCHLRNFNVALRLPLDRREAEHLYGIRRNTGTLHYSRTGNVTTRIGTDTYYHKFNNLAGKLRLKIEVAANRLILVEANGVPLEELYSDLSKANDNFINVPYHGKIGLFTLGNAATFTDVRFVLKAKK